MNIGIVDLGTNTCTLIIGHLDNSKNLQIIKKESLVVKLGTKEHYKNRNITDKGINKIIDVLLQHLATAKKFNISSLHIYSTAAIREAENKLEIQSKIESNPAFKMVILEGEEEALLTTNAVQLAAEGLKGPLLTMDIGGGSNEFVIIKNSEIIWSQSFKTGMARILQTFPFEDKIDNTIIDKVNNHFIEKHKELWLAIEKYQPQILIGSSGAFDTYVDLIKHHQPISHLQRRNKIEISDFHSLHNTLIESTKKERKEMKGMTPIRELMIVYASMLTNLVLKKSNINQMYQTGYALAEGALFEKQNSDHGQNISY